jgi:hypothetical protein
MRHLTNSEVFAVNGAIMDPVMIGLVSTTMGLAAGYLVASFPKVSTAVGTISFGLTGAAVGTLVFPIAGTFFGGCIGGFTGYMISSTLAPVAAFGGVGGITAIGLLLA